MGLFDHYRRPTSNKKTMEQISLVFYGMDEVPEAYKERLRDLSLGPFDGSMIRWSYHDGSTWCGILWVGQPDKGKIIGWVVLTFQEEAHPVVGVFVDREYRSRGYARILVEGIIQLHKDRCESGSMYCVLESYPKYAEIIESFGLKCLEWE